MKNKNILFALFLLLLICLSVQSISANNSDKFNEIDTLDHADEFNSLDLSSDDLNTETIEESSTQVLRNENQAPISQNSNPLPNIEKGTVSGGVDFVNAHPWAPSDRVNGNKGNITYNIPEKASIKSAYVFVNIYSGSGGTSYGAYANTSITTVNGRQQLGNEVLWTSESSLDGVNYIVNDHTTRCYSDYMIFYNVTDLLQGLNGSSVSVDTISYPMPNYSFDGRIKLISLFVAWDDGDEEEIYYWLNAGQGWTDDTANGLYHNFENIPNLNFNEKLSTIRNVGVSSADAKYYLNGHQLFSDSSYDEYLSGAYYQYHKWNISKDMTANSLEFRYKPVGGNYGPTFKDIISILTIEDIPIYEENEAQISLIPEYIESPCAYAGTNNTLTVKVNTKEGRYTVKLYADGKLINQTAVDLNEGANTLLITDPTIRPVDELTANGAENRKVNYTAEISKRGEIINSSSIEIPILYNGNLGKDLAYPSDGINSFLNITINGDIIIDIQNYTTYLSANYLNRTDIWNINLAEGSSIVKSLVYIPYNWFNSYLYAEDENMFNVTFNNERISPVALYRDQSNLGSSGQSGHGILVYDVSELIRNGENSLELKKNFDTPAVYPSALVYMYNTTGNRDIKEIYIYNGADLLENSNNLAGRTVSTVTEINVDPLLCLNASLYVFAASPQKDEGDLIFNGQLHENIWNGTSSSHDVYSLDISSSIKDSNTISFVSTGNDILALQQIIVIAKNIDDIKIGLESEYPNACYAGTNNQIFANISALKQETVLARLLADGVIVNESEINLIYGSNQFTFLDPTIRPVDESSVNGAENRIVNYTLQLISNNEIIANCSIYPSILYNGYLSKDYAYPEGQIEPFLNITSNGDIVIDIKEDSTYMGDFDISRTDIWNINLNGKSNIVKALIYVPYELCNINLIAEDENILDVKFNSNKIAPIAWHRDQSNLGQNGRYGYGLFVYDVSDLIKTGTNTFTINKIQPTPRVYPSTLIYIYNTTGSAVIKNIYISNGADLLAYDAYRTVQLDSTIKIDSIADLAKLYVFAANGQDGEGDIIFNDETHENLWHGSGSSTNLYTLDITNSIRNNNNIRLALRNGSIMALHEIIVTTQKAQSQIRASDLNIAYNDGGNLVIGLTEQNGNPISNAKLNVQFNGNSQILSTNDNGEAILSISNALSPNTYDIDISFAGDEYHIGSSAKAKVTVEKIPSTIDASSIATVYNNNGNLALSLKDGKGNPIANGKVTVLLNGKSYILSTNANGQGSLTIPSNLIPKTYTATIRYDGDGNHIGSATSANVVVKKASVKLTASKKTFKSKVKVKKYTVTLKNNKNKAMKKVKLSLKIKGKTFKATTNNKGKATFKIKKLSKKGKYTASIAYKGDKYYNKLTKKVKITIK